MQMKCDEKLFIEQNLWLFEEQLGKAAIKLIVITSNGRMRNR